ncbi:hypothetical protein BB560_006632 [Smittium megazygosporum]|uniref:Sphingolipid delta4-desaturase N-terminal domain-containing protein n=1 Tax=Smittium megazygosporum TaxID=133381 RepID=A0A2T9Y2R1_9FUNG|nr:hypothetical protein BB560_006632 [Smittium megazygosporum]
MTETKPTIDPRAPSFIGSWLRSIPNKDTQPTTDIYDEPHLKRKIAILKKYPQIRELITYDVRTQYITYAFSFSQLALGYYFGRMFTGSYLVYCLAAYFISGTIVAQYGVIFHEISHDLAAKTPLMNRFVGLVCNIPMLVPLAMSFRRYHLEHHSYQGVRGYDPDLPLDWEVKYIGNSPVRKFFFLTIYGIMYIGRGLAQGKFMNTWELINVVWSICWDLILFKLMGWKGIAYLVLSVLCGYGPHPGAAHFIQEHYTYADGQETYDYYGSGNWFYMNIGYHNEHHDFLNVPWSNLPKIRAIAPEYYDDLAYHTSWFKVLYQFVTCKLMAPQSRLVRSLETHKYARRNYKVGDEEKSKSFVPGVDLSLISDASLEKEYQKLVSL